MSETPERERCLAIVAARKAIYENKRDDADIFREPNYNRHEVMQHTVEALEILEAELVANETGRT